MKCALTQSCMPQKSQNLWRTQTDTELVLNTVAPGIWKEIASGLTCQIHKLTIKFTWNCPVNCWMSWKTSNLTLFSCRWEVTYLENQSHAQWFLCWKLVEAELETWFLTLTSFFSSSTMWRTQKYLRARLTLNVEFQVTGRFQLWASHKSQMDNLEEGKQ